MAPPEELPPEPPNAPLDDVSLQVTLWPMSGTLIGATDAEGGQVYVREDATEAEIGAVILSAAREMATARFPPEDGHAALVIPLPRPRPDEGEEHRGLG